MSHTTQAWSSPSWRDLPCASSVGSAMFGPRTQPDPKRMGRFTFRPGHPIPFRASFDVAFLPSHSVPCRRFHPIPGPERVASASGMKHVASARNQIMVPTEKRATRIRPCSCPPSPSTVRTQILGHRQAQARRWLACTPARTRLGRPCPRAKRRRRGRARRVLK
jgi:hypothetical protein